MVILLNTQYYNIIEIWKDTINKYYDVCYYYLLCTTPIYLRILLNWAINSGLSGEINVKMCIIEKSK